jgi:inhibitor of KinA
MDLAGAGCTAFEWMKEKAEERLKQPVRADESNQRLIRVPVCYEKEFAPDIIRLAAAKKIETGEVIQLHTSLTYKVFMLGFLPGFAYMGEVSEKIAIPRKSKPVNVKAGSVGIAGKQTGIYPLESPGGWQIIGRTPLQLFDREKEEPSLFRAGDAVQFYSITRNVFEEMQYADSSPD